jgi:4-hydroxy-4-methyl-2-oxoglutarate aldolase
MLAGVMTGLVVDAQGRRGALDHTIKPVTSRNQFVGSALTVLCRPWDNLALHVSLKFIQAGDVLVIATGAFTQAAVIGEKLVGMARNQGAVAIVTDGLVRDSAGIERVGIPVFAAGAIVNSCFKHGPGQIGLPISIGGVPVAAGDLLAGDRDGVVCVPHRDIDAVCATITGLHDEEKKMFDEILEGGSKPEAMAAISAEPLIHYVD